MTGREGRRLAGTAILAVAAAIPYATGIWFTWRMLLYVLPTPVGVAAVLGMIVAPAQLVRDILNADRADRAAAAERDRQRQALPEEP